MKKNATSKPASAKKPAPLHELAVGDSTITIGNVREFSARLAEDLREIDPATEESGSAAAPDRKRHALARFIALADSLASADSIRPKVAPTRYWRAVAVWAEAPWRKPLNIWNNLVSPELAPDPDDALDEPAAAKLVMKTPSRPTPSTPAPVRPQPTPAPSRPSVSPTMAAPTPTPAPAPVAPPPPSLAQLFDRAVSKAMSVGLMNRSAAIDHVRRTDPELYDQYVADAQRRLGVGR